MHITIIGPGAESLAELLTKIENQTIEDNNYDAMDYIQLVELLRYALGRVSTIHVAEVYKER